MLLVHGFAIFKNRIKIPVTIEPVSVGPRQIKYEFIIADYTNLCYLGHGEVIKCMLPRKRLFGKL